MYGKLKDALASELKIIEDGGLLKRERIITSPQGPSVKVNTGDNVVVMCANNYLGLTVTIQATSRAQLDEIYRTLSTHPLVRVVL